MYAVSTSVVCLKTSKQESRKFEETMHVDYDSLWGWWGRKGGRKRSEERGERREEEEERKRKSRGLVHLHKKLGTMTSICIFSEEGSRDG